ncbi:SAM-dependent methyltransferase [Amycolatopsis sp. NBRC 101858]|uniref:class I SAM-dependent methyltransferase n=1 Tax=Amycolatopsis sp. NBRC 101858 TaxID=3032200 RepID=UPI0024A33245|nr:class I SAM-dependent methyltransferase [Amycolatopsis sp. NBRC 101858]GLY40964.1 SAM-dependent methyltransferase [Amycolatopsis sp. NBRC 101858]
MTPNPWDAEAATFDDQPDHGLKDPAVRAAWAELLLPLMPAARTKVVDLGCGTGSLAVLLAEAGHDVCGVDLSSCMLDVARKKAAGLDIDFRQGDAADPPTTRTYDVVLVRHVLWALPDPAGTVARWFGLLGPGGRLILVEGRWFTGAGIGADECRELVEARGTVVELRMLDDPRWWGKPIDDQRFLLVARPNE